MGGIKRNFVYNGVLTLSQYVFPLITFPYISRVLGVENVGLVGFADSIVNYFILLSALGIGILGVREIARNVDNRQAMSEAFSSLLTIHLLFTFVFLIFYFCLVHFNSELYSHKELYYIGAAKLVANVFLVEWLFRGLEKFSYITFINILIRFFYVISIFLFVKTSSDYIVYFTLSVSVFVLNAIVNFIYARKFIRINRKELFHIKGFIYPFISFGAYIVLTSMYTTFNVSYLGFVATNTAVGYYSTALKIYVIVLGVFTALNTVMIPRMNILFTNEENEKLKELVYKSFKFVFILGFPIIFYVIMLSPELIGLFAGAGYEGAVLPLQIIIPLILIVGIAQVLANQVLVTYKKEKQMVYVAVCGAIVGITLNIILVPRFSEIGTAFVLVFSEVVVTLLLTFFVYRGTSLRIPFRDLFKNLLVSLPYILICFFAKKQFDNSLIILTVAALISLIYFYISHYYILKDNDTKDFLLKYKNILSAFFNKI